MFKGLMGTLSLLVALAAGAHGEHVGALVRSVIEGGPAARAGLRTGDRILKVGREPLTTRDDLQRILAAHRPGERVPFTVERDGATIKIPVTFGEQPDGSISLGVTLALSAAADAGDGAADGAAECLAWIDGTYGLERWTDELKLDLAGEVRAMRGCVSRDASRMNPDLAVRACDSVFKIHCSGLDLLLEVGEALVARCENELAPLFEQDPRQRERWERCGRDEVFDRYNESGTVTGTAECATVLREACGADEGASKPAGAWLQWGGPHQDFQAPAGRLATSWPADGPPRLWDRELGAGYSAILVEQGRLYTMYRDGEDEVAVALDARGGETIWEFRYRAAPAEGHQPGYGNGPRSTPLIVGDRLFTVGVAGTMHALDKHDGKVLWRRELWGPEFGGNLLSHGYSSSPAAYADMVIVPVGGEDAGVVAFDQTDGSVRWKTDRFRNSFSSPLVAAVAGRPQLLLCMAEELIGLDPDTGKLFWRFPIANQWGHNISMPVLTGEDTIFVSSPQVGARGLRVVAEGDGFRVEPVWSNRRVQVYHGSVVRGGDYVYGSTGVTAPAFLVAVDARTGEIVWRERGMAKANCVAADGKLVILDEQGTLYLASASPEQLVVQARARILDRFAWTVPTIVDTTLYARDRNRIVALDLGPNGQPPARS